MATWANKDGLKVKFGLDLKQVAGKGNVSAAPKTLEWQLDPVNQSLPGAADVDASHPSLPAGAYIQRAELVVDEAWTAAGAATLTIGLCQVDGTVIDADGIDASIAKAALAANLAVACDGALVGGTAGVGANPGYVYFTVGTGPYTAGKGVLRIQYIT